MLSQKNSSFSRESGQPRMHGTRCIVLLHPLHLIMLETSFFSSKWRWNSYQGSKKNLRFSKKSTFYSHYKCSLCLLRLNGRSGQWYGSHAFFNTKTNSTWVSPLFISLKRFMVQMFDKSSNEDQLLKLVLRWRLFFIHHLNWIFQSCTKMIPTRPKKRP